MTRLQWVGATLGVLFLIGLLSEPASTPPELVPPQALSGTPGTSADPNLQPPTASIAPQPVMGGDSGAAGSLPVQPEPPARAPGYASLAGGWRDAEGGRYRMLQVGNELRFEGMSPHGPVAGVGYLQGQVLILNYVVNGIAYVAELEVSADHRLMRGRYGSQVTGETGMVVLERMS